MDGTLAPTFIKEFPLREHTTLRVGGPARFACMIRSLDGLRSCASYVQEQKLPWFVLGGGSNILPSDSGFDGVAVCMRIEGKKVITESPNEVVVWAGAGESWDDFVGWCVGHGWWGAENLSGIPGTVGATPIQNVGAYGQEVNETIESVDVFDMASGVSSQVSNEACAFGYRDSMFKQQTGVGLIVTGVTFRFAKHGTPDLSYKDLSAYFGGHASPCLGEVRNAVLAIRAGKFPDLNEVGTAGSFFKNPIISADAYERLRARFHGLPGYPDERGSVKVSLAWILDNVCDLKGYRAGNVGLFERQPLVLVAYDGASESEIESFAEWVIATVREATGIICEREVRKI
jgi:UDP-N-acetylmuramate dehydrogenase